MEIETIDLLGKTLFTKVSIKGLVQMPTPMPDNEAGFVYVLKGKCINHSETDELQIEANQGVLAKSGNSIFKTVNYHESDEYEAISVRFHKDVLSELYKDDEFPFFEKPNVSLSANSVLLPPNTLINEYIKSILPYFKNKELLSGNLLTLKLKELITLLLQTENSVKIIQIMSNLFEKKTFEFKEVIKSHIFSSISIQELAQLSHMSMSSFKKEFSRIFNTSPQNYIIGKRIEKVAEALPNTGESLSNIAYDCQFQTLAHMSRVFKSKYGVSPSEYRKNLSDK